MVLKDIYGDKLREVSEYNSKQIELFLEKLKPKLVTLRQDLESSSKFSKETSLYRGSVLAEYFVTRSVFPYLEEKVQVLVEHYENYLRVSVEKLGELGNNTHLFIAIFNPKTEDLSCTWCDTELMAPYFGLKVLSADSWHMLNVTNTSTSIKTVEKNQENFLSLFELKSTE